MTEPVEPRVQRVRVTSSRSAGPVPGARPLARELDEQTGLGEVYLRGLMGAQLRLAITVLMLGVVSLGGLPALFVLVPSTRGLNVLGIPFPWLALGILVYPAAVLVCRYYVRQAERVEAEFTEAMRRS